MSAVAATGRLVGAQPLLRQPAARQSTARARAPTSQGWRPSSAATSRPRSRAACGRAGRGGGLIARERDQPDRTSRAEARTARAARACARRPRRASIGEHVADHPRDAVVADRHRVDIAERDDRHHRSRPGPDAGERHERLSSPRRALRVAKRSRPAARAAARRIVLARPASISKSWNAVYGSAASRFGSGGSHSPRSRARARTSRARAGATTGTPRGPRRAARARTATSASKIAPVRPMRRPGLRRCSSPTTPSARNPEGHRAARTEPRPSRARRRPPPAIRPGSCRRRAASRRTVAGPSGVRDALHQTPASARHVSRAARGAEGRACVRDRSERAAAGRWSVGDAPRRMRAHALLVCPRSGRLLGRAGRCAAPSPSSCPTGSTRTTARRRPRTADGRSRLLEPDLRYEHALLRRPARAQRRRQLLPLRRHLPLRRRLRAR